jgi:hypothetical protein
MKNTSNIYKSDVELLAELLTETREIKTELKEIKSRLPGRDRQIAAEIGVIDNSELLQAMHITSPTARHWRNTGVLRFTKIGAKFYYLLEDIKAMLRERFGRH